MAAVVPLICENSLQCFRGALIQQNSHLSWATKLSLASSIAAMASSRVTLGYCSRNDPACRHLPDTRSRS